MVFPRITLVQTVSVLNEVMKVCGLLLHPCTELMKPEGRGLNSHPGQSFPLSLCGPNSINRANAHMVYR